MEQIKNRAWEERQQCKETASAHQTREKWSGLQINCSHSSIQNGFACIPCFNDNLLSLNVHFLLAT